MKMRAIGDLSSFDLDGSAEQIRRRAGFPGWVGAACFNATAPPECVIHKKEINVCPLFSDTKACCARLESWLFFVCPGSFLSAGPRPAFFLFNRCKIVSPRPVHAAEDACTCACVGCLGSSQVKTQHRV